MLCDNFSLYEFWVAFLFPDIPQTVLDISGSLSCCQGCYRFINSLYNFIVILVLGEWMCSVTYFQPSAWQSEFFQFLKYSS